MQPRHLADRLADWIERGLLSDEQRQRILEYEAGRAAGKGRSWVLYGLLMLGGTVVGIGVISLIAANWDEIPAGAKLGGAFAALIALAWLAYRAREEGRHIRFEVLAVLLSLGVLGTIGLVAQVYHTGGELFLALTLWVVAIGPLALACSRGFVPQLWTAASLAAFVAWVLAEGWWERLGLRWEGGEQWSLFLATPLLCLLVSNLLARRPSGQVFSRAYAAWSLAGALTAVAVVDFAWSIEHPRIGAGLMIATVLAAVLAVVTLWLRDDLPEKGRLAVAALVAVALLAFVPFAFDLGGHHGGKGSQLIGAAFSVVALLLLAAWFAARETRRWFNAMTVLVGVRLLIVYLQVIGDLATTGLGLVVSGLVIIGVALLWVRTRARVEALFGGLVR